MAITPKNFAVTNTGSPVQVIAASTLVSSVYFENAGVAVMYVGVAGVSATLYTAKLAIGGGFLLKSDALGKLGGEIDLSKIYVNGTAADKLMVTYLTRTGP